MAKQQKSLGQIFTAGIIKENPVLRLVLGTCPTLAVTTMAMNGLGMGAAATVVLIGSNLVISLLRKVIPDKIHIPAYITIIAGFVTSIQMFVRAYAPALDSSLGIYLPLIVVNCIILGRAESFCKQERPFGICARLGLGMGIGFTITLVLMGSIRELIGNGNNLRPCCQQRQHHPTDVNSHPGLQVVSLCLAVLGVALANKVAVKKGKEPAKLGCGGCPMHETCSKAAEGGCD